MLNELFVKELESLSIDSKYIEPIIDEFLRYFNKANEEANQNISILKNRSNELTTKINTIEERFAIGEIERELYTKFTGNYRKERQAVSNEITNTKT